MAALTSGPDRDDPYPVYARLRAAGTALEAPDGAMVVTGHRAVSALMRDHRLTKNPGRVLAAQGLPDWRDHPSLAMMFDSLLMRNPPEHTRLRTAVAQAFTPRRVAALEPAVRDVVADLLDRFDTSGPVDFVAAFAFPLPVTVIGELLGIPAPDRSMFEQLVHDWAGVLELLSPLAVERADVAAREIAAYLDALAADRLRRPAEDMMSSLVASDLTRDEVVTMAALLLAAGFETTTGLLSNGLVALLEHPDQVDWWRAHPGDSESATTELLRFDSPTQMQFGRTAAAELTVGPVTLRAGQRVVSLIGSGNRDPDVYDAPDELCLDRVGPPPLSFGGGIHYCLGAPLARLETSIAMQALITRFGSIGLAGEPVRRTTLALRGHTALPIAVSA